MTSPLCTALRRLAELHRDTTDAAEAVAQARAMVERTLEGQVLAQRESRLASLKDELSQTDKLARSLTLQAYQATQNKKPAPGAQIRLYTCPRYDPEAMLAWCERNRPTYVVRVLDATRVNANATDLARDGAPIEMIEEARAAIDKDLGAYLAGDADEAQPVVFTPDAERRAG